MCFYQRLIFPCSHGVIEWLKVELCKNALQHSDPNRQYKCPLRVPVGGFISQHEQTCAICESEERNKGTMGYGSPPADPVVGTPVMRGSEWSDVSCAATTAIYLS
jgi:hypothetical protein